MQSQKVKSAVESLYMEILSVTGTVVNAQHIYFPFPF